MEAFEDEQGREGEEDGLLVGSECVGGEEDGDRLSIAGWWMSGDLGGEIGIIRLAIC